MTNEELQAMADELREHPNVSTVETDDRVVRAMLVGDDDVAWQTGRGIIEIGWVGDGLFIQGRVKPREGLERPRSFPDVFLDQDAAIERATELADGDGWVL